MVAKHPFAKQSIIITLLMHASQQNVDLCIAGCVTSTHARGGVSPLGPTSFLAVLMVPRSTI